MAMDLCDTNLLKIAGQKEIQPSIIMKKEYYLQKDNKHTHTQPEERKEKQIA